MPIYEYNCSECNCQFDRYLSVTERETPVTEPCPECGETKVRKGISVTTMGVDMNCTPDRKTNGDWSKLVDKLKHGTPERYHKSLDATSTRSGGKLGPQ